VSLALDIRPQARRDINKLAADFDARDPDAGTRETTQSHRRQCGG